MCLAKGHNTVTQVRLESATPRFWVKHSITEPQHSFGMVSGWYGFTVAVLASMKDISPVVHLHAIGNIHMNYWVPYLSRRQAQLFIKGSWVPLRPNQSPIFPGDWSSKQICHFPLIQERFLSVSKYVQRVLFYTPIPNRARIPRIATNW